MNDNHRETGARKPVEDHRPEPTNQNAAMPDKPKPYGLTEPANDAAAKHGSKAPSGPVVEKVTGAGPALAEHSKDAKAGKSAERPTAGEKN